MFFHALLLPDNAIDCTSPTDPKSQHLPIVPSSLKLAMFNFSIKGERGQKNKAKGNSKEIKIFRTKKKYRIRGESIYIIVHV